MSRIAQPFPCQGGAEPTPLMVFVNNFRQDEAFETKVRLTLHVLWSDKGVYQFGACSPKIGRGRGEKLGEWLENCTKIQFFCNFVVIPEVKGGYRMPEISN